MWAHLDRESTVASWLSRHPQLSCWEDLSPGKRLKVLGDVSTKITNEYGVDPAPVVADEEPIPGLVAAYDGEQILMGNSLLESPDSFEPVLATVHESRHRIQDMRSRVPGTLEHYLYQPTLTLTRVSNLLMRIPQSSIAAPAAQLLARVLYVADPMEWDAHGFHARVMNQMSKLHSEHERREIV